MASSRYTGTTGAVAAEGYVLERIVPPSRLFGANGIRAGADGRVYVAQVAGSAITALDVDTGEAEIVSAIDGPITSPDDLAFDSLGNIYATEITLGRVSMLSPSGDYRVIDGDMPVANPVTVFQDRLIAGECRMGGRIFELSRDGGPRRLIAEDLPMPNAFEIGPDGKLYIPLMGVNEIWRIDPEGGEPEVVAGDLGVPDSVKFDAGGRIVSTQVATGEVLRIDPQTGTREVLARLSPGLDNCTFVDERLFVSSIPGEVVEIGADGTVRSLVGRGLQWPMGLACAADDTLFAADGGFTYTVSRDGGLEVLGMLFTSGFPGFTRGVASAGPGEWLTTNSMGAVMRWWPAKGESVVISAGHEVLYGVASTSGGGAVFADGAAGKVVLCSSGRDVEALAQGLHLPMGVAVSGDGAVYVSESGAGRVIKIAGGRTDVVIDGLEEPQGITISGGRLFTVDVGAKTLFSSDLPGGDREVLAENLPVKAPPGIVPKLLGGVGDMSGPMVPMCGVAVDSHGTVYVSGDAEGSVIAIRREGHA